MQPRCHPSKAGGRNGTWQGEFPHGGEPRYGDGDEQEPMTSQTRGAAFVVLGTAGFAFKGILARLIY
ncbi:MAG: hypothetical protein KC912_21575, partial [Proteobacteria bacterium]|nr:hypothetical protein [Pseudomonadota bacterium]